MVDRWLVFGGWAVNPTVLAPLFGQNATFVDIGSLMPQLVENGTLRPDWGKRCAKLVAPLLQEGAYGIAGWSTGAILACGCVPHLSPQAGVFISATPSFCRRPEFPHGWRSSILESMRIQLLRDACKVREQFFEQCGIPRQERSRFTGDDTPETLNAGLQFLEQASLLPVASFGIPALFLHGKNDAIVPFEAGRDIAEMAGGIFAEFDGSHAFFMGHRERVVNRIREFMNDEEN